jgi:hypothetical protein
VKQIPHPRHRIATMGVHFLMRLLLDLPAYILLLKLYQYFHKKAILRSAQTGNQSSPLPAKLELASHSRAGSQTYNLRLKHAPESLEAYYTVS